ncbi:GLIPR1-like protein 1 [Brachyhypopomus gauderio]|uniref:GLIPR1-like protein 1 n=1 Tax=Brachyhypopomus gauderio TaxID=698409 RepID=UPI0040419937
MMHDWHQSLSFLILLLFSLAFRTTTNPFCDIVDKAFIEACLREHNAGRSNVSPPASNMRYMTWDESLAITARAWARKCVYEHNIYLGETGRVHPVFTTVGENIWAGAPYSTFSVKKAIEDWIAEYHFYEYHSLHCNNVCGHYTQVVWADTYLVGCAVQACPNGVAKTSFSSTPGAIFVCNYAPGGNYHGHSPYMNGVSCSSCGNEKCDNQLCHNVTREAPRRYNWTPDWDPALFLCGSFCKTVLIIRPISLFFIFSYIYFLQHRYTNLFAYTS